MSEQNPIRIVIAQRGWVFVGRLESASEHELVFGGAKIVRRWGTAGKGLGYLAVEGPQPNTFLDEAGTVRFHPLAVVAQIDCTAESWSL